MTDNIYSPRSIRFFRIFEFLEKWHTMILDINSYLIVLLVFHLKELDALFWPVSECKDSI